MTIFLRSTPLMDENFKYNYFTINIFLQFCNNVDFTKITNITLTYNLPIIMNFLFYLFSMGEITYLTYLSIPRLLLPTERKVTSLPPVKAKKLL